MVETKQSGDLGGIGLLVLLIDAVVLGRGLLAAVGLGIDAAGQLSMLGFRNGSSENVVHLLLCSLSKRGLSPVRDRCL